MKNQTFGIEIETTGLGCERTAKAIAQHFGTTATYVGRHPSDWHIGNYMRWLHNGGKDLTDECS